MEPGPCDQERFDHRRQPSHLERGDPSGKLGWRFAGELDRLQLRSPALSTPAGVIVKRCVHPRFLSLGAQLLG
jgi:hypothetical protein